MRNFYVLVCALLALTAVPAERAFTGEHPTKTRIYGTVSGDGAPKAVTILKEGKHPLLSPKKVVPVIDGKFGCELSTDWVELYVVVPGESISSVDFGGAFFSEGADVRADIVKKEGEFEVSVSSASPLTRRLHEFLGATDSDPEYLAYDAAIDSLYEHNLYYTPEYDALSERLSGASEQVRKALYAQMDSLERAGRKYTAAAMQQREQGQRLQEKWARMELEVVSEKATVLGLYQIAANLWIPSAQNHEQYIALYEKLYKGRFEGHPYVADIEKSIPVYRDGVSGVGSRYVDVEALDASGRMQPVSRYIAGKVALIDLWASWCLPCRRTSRALIPLYERFAPRGFAVIGLAREIEDDRNLRQVERQDGYPWPSLAEIDDRNLIWTVYGTPNGPGKTLLVDRDGTILLIDPSLEELERKLNELLPGN